MQKLIVVLGPTASGKSDIAVLLAQKIGGEIISADSRQVYQGLDIGSGKITKKEMKKVRHHLLDVLSPKKRFSASDFVRLAGAAIEEIGKAGKLPIICGGTGFYIDALLGDKQIPEVPPNLKLREKLEKKSAAELFEMLKKMDPERATNIDAKNPRRLVRAIEICEALGKVPRLADSGERLVARKYDVLKIGIAPITPSPAPSSYNKRKGEEIKKEIISSNPLLLGGGLGVGFLNEKELKKRINKRIEKWFRQGLLKEVRGLHQKGLSWKRMGEIGLEYKIVALYLQDKISKKEMIEQMQTETRAYAKRQMTWFKKTKDVTWFTPSKAKGLPPKINQIEKEARKFL